MTKPLQRILLVAGCLLACPTASVVAQEPVATSNVVHVLGLEGVKKTTKAHLFVSSVEVRFEAGAAKAYFAGTDEQVPFGFLLDAFQAKHVHHVRCSHRFL